MEKSVQDDLVYRMDISSGFYIYRILLFIVPIVLIFMKVDYWIIIFAALGAALLITNNNNYIIEVYRDNFKLILPSFWFNLFKEEEVFYFKDIKDYQFEKGKYNLLNRFLLGIVRESLGMYIGGKTIYNKYSTMHFNYNSNGNVRTIKREFGLSQTKQLLEASKHIEGAIKHTSYSTGK